MQDHFEPNTMSFQLTEEVFDIYSTLQHADPGITAQGVFHQMNVEWMKALKMVDYIYAVYAGWEEFKHPTFITKQIKSALEPTEQSGSTCNDSSLIEGVDKIDFSLQKFPYGMAFVPLDVASIFVNGKSFRDIIKQAELPSATRNGEQNKAGTYCWLTVSELVEELTEVRNLNDVNYIEPRIMDCGCGCDGCWPLHVKIVETEDRVSWSGFYNPHKIDSDMTEIPWDYSGMREYRFDKKQYYDEIEKLKTWYESQ